MRYERRADIHEAFLQLSCSLICVKRLHGQYWDVLLAERLGLPRLGGSPPLLAVLLVDSLGTGLFAPFSLLFFHAVAGLPLPAVGLALSGAPPRRPALKAGHWPMVSVPDEPVALLAEIASGRVRP